MSSVKKKDMVFLDVAHNTNCVDMAFLELTPNNCNVSEPILNRNLITGYRNTMSVIETIYQQSE